MWLQADPNQVVWLSDGGVGIFRLIREVFTGYAWGDENNFLLVDFANQKSSCFCGEGLVYQPILSSIVREKMTFEQAFKTRYRGYGSIKALTLVSVH